MDSIDEAGWLLHLDRCLDQYPIGFTATEASYRSSMGISKSDMKPFPNTFKCEAIEDCTTWHQVEQKMKEILISMEAIEEDNEVVIERSDNDFDNWHMYGIKAA